jgi:hypothetical protein
MPNVPLELADTSVKMIDALIAQESDESPYSFPSRYPTALLPNKWVNVNTWLLQVKGCFIVMDTRSIDWFARVSDWRRY